MSGDAAGDTVPVTEKIQGAKRTRTEYVMKFLPQIALNSSLKRAKSEWYWPQTVARLS